VVLVEATIPLTQTDASAEWEPLVTGAGYRFCYFDGLNRFYVAEEKWAALGRHFAVPPNVFDGFTLAGSGTALTEAKLRKVEAELAVMRAEPVARPALGPALAVPGVILRAARWLRHFLSAELRDEIGRVRADLALLRSDLDLLSHKMDEIRRQLRP
jgi:hypothetical protein